MKNFFNKARTVFGIIAAVCALIFGTFLFSRMLGYPIDGLLLSSKLGLAEAIRLLAEFTIGALLLAAIAFL